MSNFAKENLIKMFSFFEKKDNIVAQKIIITKGNL